MATYRVELRTLAVNGFTQTVSSLDLTTFACNWVLNGPGAFDGSGVLGFVDDDIDNVGARQLVVYRDNSAIWHGYLTYYSVDADSRLVRIGAEGLWSRARRRLVRGTKVYRPSTNGNTAWKAHDVAWELLSDTQDASAGDLGWVQGSHTGTQRNLKRVFCGPDRANIGLTIEGLADDGYFDFALTPNASPTSSNIASFDTWATRGTNRTGTVNLSGSNAMTLTYSRSASDLSTVADAFGEQDECGGVASTASANTATYGRLEADPIDVDTDEQGEVDQAAAELLAANKVPAYNATVTYLEGVGPALSAYDLGDTIRISPADDIVSSFDLRVMERELAVEAGKAVVTVVCEERP